MRKNWLELFWPQNDSVPLSEKALSAVAAIGGIGLVMWISSLYLAPADLPWVVASMGASAVLLFAVPLGPLSQPWSFAGGHLVSGLIGITVAHWIPDTVLAATVAVSLAIFVMYVTRCLHPPGGATALTVVIGSPQVHELGYHYLLTPVTLNIIVMLVWALLINNLLPRRYYPNTLKSFLETSECQPGDDRIHATTAITRDDLHHALKEMGEFIDVSEDDLSRIFQMSTTHARRRRMGEILVGEIMTREVISANYDTPVKVLWGLMHQHKIRGIPIVDKQQRVIGIVTIADFLKQVEADDSLPLKQRLVNFIRPSPGLTADKPEYAGHVMTSPALTVREDQHILDLFPIYYERGLHRLPVVDNQGKLSGIVTPRNLLISLHADLQDSEKRLR
ncbi:MAG: HPP family protein [bacterium]